MRSALATLIIALSLGTSGAAFASDGDLVFHNGKVLTADTSFSVQSVVVVSDGKIKAVGGPELLARYPEARRIDLKGRTLMPGFIDTHLHVAAHSFRAIEASKARSIVDIQRMLRAKAAELGPGEWISGGGWDEAVFAERRVPTRTDLDAAAPHNPVILRRAGGHSSVANSRALKLAGIDASTPDPEGGLIERGADGQPNGVIRERADIVSHLIPPDTPAQMRVVFVQKLKSLLKFGITTAMEALTTIDDEPVGKGGLAPDAKPGIYTQGRMSWSVLRSIYKEQGANLPRLIAYIDYPGAERLKAFPYRTGQGDDRLKLGPVGETPYDGGFTGPTALTKKDYKGLPNFRGKAMMTVAEAREMVTISASLGWQLGIHTIGDQAIETMVSLYEEELKRRPKKDHRWFLSHFTMIPSQATMETMAREGIWAAAQPNFLYTLESRYQQTLEGYDLEHNNPVAVPLAKGVRVAFGSDNLPIGPMAGLYSAVSRKGRSGKVFGGEEAVSREQAIRLYTQQAAYLGWDEKKKGSLEPGKFADMIVLDRDPMTVPLKDMMETQVDMTIVSGRIVYER